MPNMHLLLDVGVGEVLQVHVETLLKMHVVVQRLKRVHRVPDKRHFQYWHD